MNRKDTNRVNMIDSTTGYCDLNTAATAGIPAFAITITAVKAKMVLINALNQIGTGTSKGVTTDTKLLRKTMTDLALKCGNATKGYANSIHNNTLLALVNFTRSKLDALSKEDVDDVCQSIHDATDANVAGATNYGITASDVTDLATAISVYRTATQNPRQAIISKSQAILQAKQMVREVINDLLIGQLDVMANTLQVTNNNFWTGYHQAREIIDLGSTTAKVRGDVRDENTVPLKGVDFTIYETGTLNKVAEATTDIKGKYGASKLPAGNFDFVWELKGYKTVNETNVHISAGKDLRRKIVMQAIVVIEGDVMPLIIANIDANGVNITPGSMLTIEAVNSVLRFYASDTVTGTPGATFLDVQAGQTVTHTAQEFETLLGMNDVKHFVNVQNVGGAQGHYKITIEV